MASELPSPTSVLPNTHRGRKAHPVCLLCKTCITASAHSSTVTEPRAFCRFVFQSDRKASSQQLQCDPGLQCALSSKTQHSGHKWSREENNGGTKQDSEQHRVTVLTEHPQRCSSAPNMPRSTNKQLPALGERGKLNKTKKREGIFGFNKQINAEFCHQRFKPERKGPAEYGLLNIHFAYCYTASSLFLKINWF